MNTRSALRLGALAALALGPAGAAGQGRGAADAGGTRRNVVLIVADDHRYDFLGFHPNAPAWLETPALDRMAREGAHVANAFVTTSLCSPSRASMLTGQTAPRHRAVDNVSEMRPGLATFPEALQRAGYATAFVGKWHIGEERDDPRPGFDHWTSFRGQGTYTDPVLNVDGRRAQVRGYTTDLLTDDALGWLRSVRGSGKPFFLFLSHKAVHAEFEPAPRHAGRYANAPIRYPATMARTEANVGGLPQWVQAQRYGWHGVGYAYHGALDFDTFYRRYAETLLALDESVGRVLDHLVETGLDRNTLVVYLGDNGFSFGEHGLIDKRHAYEESIRVPMLAWGPGVVPAGTTVTPLVLGLDVAPTALDLAGARMPDGHTLDGRSFAPLLRGQRVPDWRRAFVYQYFWDYNFPHTPTTFALREDRYKYVFYHGVWDRNELFDLATDPAEAHNLLDVPAYRAKADSMRERLFDTLDAADAVDVRFRRPRYGQQADRLLPDG